MPTGRCCCELLPHQLPAAAMPHDLPEVHGVARADRPARKMRQASLVGGPMMRMRAPVVRPRAAMTRPGMLYAPCVTLAHVDPAVARTGTGHRREGRRRRQRLGFGHGRGLRGLRHRLLGWRLLRAERRSEHPESEGCAGKGHDTLHDIFPFRPSECLRRPRSEDRLGLSPKQPVQARLQPDRRTDWR